MLLSVLLCFTRELRWLLRIAHFIFMVERCWRDFRNLSSKCLFTFCVCIVVVVSYYAFGGYVFGFCYTVEYIMSRAPVTEGPL